jgi:hypothetical protein
MPAGSPLKVVTLIESTPTPPIEGGVNNCNTALYGVLRSMQGKFSDDGYNRSVLLVSITQLCAIAIPLNKSAMAITSKCFFMRGILWGVMGL